MPSLRSEEAEMRSSHPASRQDLDEELNSTLDEESSVSPELSYTAPFISTAAHESAGIPTPNSRTIGEGSAILSSSGADQTSNRNLTDYGSLSTLPLSPGNQNIAPLLFEMNSYNSLVSDGDGAFGTDTTSFTSSMLSPVNQFDFRASAFDWLDFNVPDMAVPEASLLTPIEDDESHEPATALPVLEPRQTVQPWPFDQTQESVPSQYQLPPLRLVLQGALQSQSCDRRALPHGLVSLLSEPWLPPQEILDHTSLLPAVHLLRRLLDAYFTRFHPIQPVTHVPTWNMSSCPTVLLAAMACIGARVSDDPHAVELSESLSSLCGPIITWLGASDSTCYRNISYLDSLCLHQIYSLGSGSRVLYQNADRSRGVLIGSLRGLGLLNSNLHIEDDMQDFSLASANSSTIHSEWIAWIGIERERRTAWASFEYDCSLCTLTSRRGAVDLSELPRRLPCPESLWEAPSATAWVALRSRLGSNATGTPYSNVLSAVLANKPVPEHTSCWGKRLCAQIIGRMLWDLKQLEILSARDYFGLASLSAVQQQPKASLLRALDNLVNSMDHPTSTSGLISYNIASLLCHYSHLYTTPDVMDITLFIFRSVASRDSKFDKAVGVAERRLQSAFAKDAREARRLVSHAAQIVAVANEYLVSAPCEILRLFMGYVFIIAFAKYFPRGSQPIRGQSLPRIRLDVSLHQPSQKQAIADWVVHGGPASIGSVKDICSGGSVLAISQEAQSMLQRLRAWGLAEKFIKILQSFESHGA
ncbi:uncharacterized protein PV09_06028 [Verruconis gallopava]|uniref:Xylanolytic transcriptional activator regulatory domain-containing protein n=1 Tax=Verruconis gallopava TaxID=253628 RepID=A0A0D1YPN2_9PEZI|nr:uncharacterized protein PV09_06028 [Verruconis gallopava]KIW02577.1 hypothetical protein PV09_06028 [Verruconis gallopava]